MKLLLYCDLHAYRHMGSNLFVKTAGNFLNHTREYAIKHKIKHVFFLGDMFQIKTRVDSMDFIFVRDIIRQWRDELKMYFLIGNHDMPLPESTKGSIMFAFDEYGEVVSNYSHCDIDNVRFHMMSYRKNGIDSFLLPKFDYNKETKNVLLMHQDMAGFRMNNLHVSDVGFKINQFKKMDMVFSGHYHLHQQNGNVVFIGAPFQTNFGERDTRHGFVTLDTKTLEWRFHEFKDAPKFKYVEYAQMEKVNVENCFVKVIIPSDIKNTRPIFEKMRLKGALSCDITTASDELIKELEFVEELNKSSILNLAKQFLDNVDIPEGLSKKRLISILEKINDEYLTQRA